MVIKIPYPKIKISGVKKPQNLTLNNYMKAHWATLSKFKMEFKNQLKEWYIPKPTEQYKSLEITCKIIYRKHIDAINVALVLKIVEDVLTDIGYVKDDKYNRIILEPTNVDKEYKDPIIELDIRGVSDAN